MAAFRSLFAVFLLAVASSSSVSPVDEERAINATQLLIQRLETDMSVRIRNVSTTPRRINAENYSYEKYYSFHFSRQRS